MRILHIIGKRPKGGIGTVVRNYQKYISDYEIQFDYLIFDDYETGDFDEKVKKMDSRVYVLPELKQKRLFTLRCLIKEFFKNHSSDYDIIELHSPNIAFLIHKYAFKYGIEHRITHSHSIKLSNNKIKAIRNRILCSSINSLTTDFFACSKEAGITLFGKEIIYDDKFQIINNSIQLSDFEFDYDNRNDLRKSCGIQNDDICLIHVGRFSKEKNHEFLLSFAQKLKEKHMKFKMIFVGDGELYEHIRNEAKLKQLNDFIIFTGHVSNVKDYLDIADIFMLPSFVEGVPLSVIEAQANGLNCIISDTVPQVIVSDTCFYKPLDVDQWLKAIQACNIDPHKRFNSIQALDAAGFNIEKEAKKLSALYKQICS